jgi:hypothetical protein
VTKFAGVNVAASVLSYQGQRQPSKDVARTSNQSVRPPAPTGLLSSMSMSAAKMELHLFEEQDLADKEEGRFVTWIEAQFNPNTLKETISAVWSDIVVPGLSHERRHYSHTKSVPFKFALQFDALAYMRNAGTEYVERAMNFLRSLGYASINTGAPPRVLFFWPNFISLTATIEEISFDYTGWLPSGEAIRFSAEITLKEIRDAHMTRTDILVAGNQRSSQREIG